MKRFNLLVWIILLSWASLNAQNLDSTKGGGSGISSEIIKIPNYTSSANYENQTINHFPIISGSEISSSGNGHGSGYDLLSCKENPERPGFPLDWVCNSKMPILRNHGKTNSIILPDKDRDLYLGYLMQIHKKEVNFIISFKNYSKTGLNLIFYNAGNSFIQDTIINLPSGVIDNHEIKILVPSETMLLFLRFDKPIEGAFQLEEFHVKYSKL